MIKDTDTEMRTYQGLSGLAQYNHMGPSKAENLSWLCSDGDVTMEERSQKCNIAGFENRGRRP